MSAAWWSALEIMARYGVQFVVMVILARLLTPEDFGLIAMMLVFTSIGTLLVDSGFGTALVRLQHTTADDETTVFIFTVCAGIITAGVLVLAAPAIATFFDQPKLIALTRLMALVLPLGALAAVPDALLTMKLDFKARARAEVIAALCSGLVAIGLAWRGLGVWSLAWQGIVAIGVRGMLLWVYSGWRPRGRYRSASFRSLFGFGGYILLSNLVDVIATRLQSLLIGRLFDSRELGFYTLAQNTQQAPASFIGGILNRVGLPVLSSVAQQPAKLRGALRLSLRVAMFLFVPCMMGIAVVAEPLVSMIYGPRWVPAAPILSILAVSTSLWPMHVLNLAAISAQGRSDLFLKLTVIKSVVGMVLVALCSLGGAVAIAFGVLVSSLFSVVVNAHYSKKMLDFGLLAQLTDQLGTIVLSALAALAGWIVLHETAGGMIFAVLAAVATYLAGASISRQKALNDFLSLLRSMRPDQKSPADVGIKP